MLIAISQLQNRSWVKRCALRQLRKYAFV